MTDHPFWHSMWQGERLGFHQSTINAHLAAAESFLTDAGAQRVLVPLCGKSRDLLWLKARFDEVVGVEFVETAVAAFFAEQGLSPSHTADLGLARYEVDGLALLAADIFDVTAAAVGPLDAVYDRAALIALPAEVRPRYVEHILSLSRPGTRILLLTMHGDYPSGPPFSVSDDEVRALYGARCGLERDDAGQVTDLPESLADKGVRATVWRIQVR
ncbi:MAG: thiopurine S-methyltransferase [Myxococcota bacterium]